MPNFLQHLNNNKLNDDCFSSGSYYSFFTLSCQEINFKSHSNTVILGKLEKNAVRKNAGVVAITTAQLHSTKPELRFCAGSNPARGMLEIRDGEDLRQWSRLEMRINAFRRSTIPKKKFIYPVWFYSPLLACAQFSNENERYQIINLNENYKSHWHSLEFFLINEKCQI